MGAEADGQRGQDTVSCKVPEGEFDFLGYSFGRMYYSENRPGAPRVPAMEEKHQERMVVQNSFMR